MTPADQSPPAGRRWYQGIERAQWLVLFIASAGWIFDAYAAQIFNVTRASMLGEVLHLKPGDPAIKFWGDTFIGIFLVGGAVGGTLFGSLADRFGRRPMMLVTIGVYSVFSALTCLAHNAWEVAALRFLVALGTAGEWAVAAALVAEVFPVRSRAEASTFFHATSSIGTWLASLAGLAVGVFWRYGYLVGVAPALLLLWVIARAPESPSWKRAQMTSQAKGRGSFKDLLSVQPWGRRAVLGMLLATVGLGTYWCVAVGGQDLVQDFLLRRHVAPAEALSKAIFDYGWLINGGGFVGMIAFGPFAQWLGRRRAFAWAMVGGACVVPITWYLPQTYGELLPMLPLYGFFTFGFHGGFALYLPELFPTRLRGTGTGFCFNGARLLAAPLLAFSGWLKSRPGLDLRGAASLLALLYLAGIVLIWFLPETKNQELTDA